MSIPITVASKYHLFFFADGLLNQNFSFGHIRPYLFIFNQFIPVIPFGGAGRDTFYFYLF